MKNPTLDPMHQGIMLGMQEAFEVARKRARDTGTPLVFWRDGKVVHVSPDDPSLPTEPGCADKS